MYEEAILGAKRSRYTLDYALACELYAEAIHKKDLVKSQQFLVEALKTYTKLGAYYKVIFYLNFQLIYWKQLNQIKLN